jgi:hypothetical protein
MLFLPYFLMFATLLADKATGLGGVCAPALLSLHRQYR